MTHYVVGLPVTGANFYGRRREIDAALAQGWTWICSQRRIGKTSLLMRIRERLAQQGSICLFANIAGLDHDQLNGDGLFEHVFAANASPSGPLAHLGLSLEDFRSDSAPEKFVRLISRVRERAASVALFLDEAEVLCEVERGDPGFLNRLRNRLHGMEGFVFFLSGTQRLSALIGLPSNVSSFLHSFFWLPLAGLDTEDAVALLDAEQTGRWKRPLPDELVQRALGWSGGHPLMLAELASRLGGQCEYDGAKLKQAQFADTQAQLAGNIILRGIVQDDFGNLDASQQALLTALCETPSCLDLAAIAGQTGLAVGDLEDAARLLVSYGYITTTECRRLRYGFYKDLRPRTPVVPRTDATKLAKVATRSVFISYSHEDEATYLEELKTSLTPLTRQHNLELWSDSRIVAGQPWKQEIDRALERASAAVFLITPGFLNSDFIRNEELRPLLLAASKRQCQVLCLFVKPSVVDDLTFEIEGMQRPLTYYQGLNEPSRPLSLLAPQECQAAIVDAARKIARVVNRDGVPQPL